MRDLERVPEPIRTHVRRLLRKHPEAARRIRDSREKRGHVAATDLWPTIAGLLCWKGGNAPLYLRQLETWYPGRIAMDFGFLASEGSFSIPLSPEGARGVTAVTGHLIEFVPEKEMENGRPARTYLADELETGARYRVLVTGSHGLYRYDLNDVVECVGYHAKTAEIAFLHKGGNMANLTGEKIGESHAVAAARRAEERTGLSFAGFCLGYEGSDPPRYVFGVELQEAIPENQSRRLLHACEVSLRESNIEYAAKRDSLRLGDPRLVLLRPGALETYRRRRVSAGAPDAQVKTRTLLHDMRDLERREGPISDCLLADWYERIFLRADTNDILDVRPAVEKERLFRQKAEVWGQFGYSDDHLERMKSQSFWDAEYARIPEIDEACLRRRGSS
jgi:hypothetical protein